MAVNEKVPAGGRSAAEKPAAGKNTEKLTAGKSAAGKPDGEKTTAIGKRGEDLALRKLLENGYTLVERNYRFHKSEIDLIMRKGKYLVFVEVKARSSSLYGTPGEFVTARKQAYLIRGAQGYLLEHRCQDLFCRFDVAEVYLQEGRVEIIENAFVVR